MNDVFRLIGKMDSKGHVGKPGPARIPSGSWVNIDRIDSLCHNLEDVLSFWEKDTFGITPLIRVQYISTVAKSNRLGRLLLDRNAKSINEQVVGAEFTKEENPKHIITYRVLLETISASLNLLYIVRNIVKQVFNGRITSNDIEAINDGKKSIRSEDISKSVFTKIIKDCYYAESFSIKNDRTASIRVPQLVSIYETGLSYHEIIRRIGSDFRPADRLDDFTWLLTPAQYAMVVNVAPYLVSMRVPDLNDFGRNVKKIPLPMGFSIPRPSDEPIIGVIDTLFSTDVYFSEWVDYRQVLDSALVEERDYEHGTEVTSIIVDGPTLNEALDDGCGRFRVRHFGVSKDGKMSSLSIIKSIREIIINNKDIKVWNLSIGSEMPINSNFISPEAAVLDELQYEYDVIFVIAGTNNNHRGETYPPIGSPADSINSITVNSVDFSNVPAPYSRRGPVLRFFNKPDVSAFGGVESDQIRVYGPKGCVKVQGTSFAAPWIARKLAYLIHVMNLSKEAAKAIIIDAAAGWNTNISDITIKGYGMVPIRIEDIIRCKDDEIRFFISSNILDYDTYTSSIPLPHTKKGFPYRFRVTLCYTPRCHRNQGVDYTDTELDIHFGRYRNGKMISINNNEQGVPYFIDLPESKARSDYRKWDNVKHITEGLTDTARIKKLHDESDIYWGMSLKTVERLDDKPGKGMPFCAVVTMKAIDNQNRAEQFVKLCNTTHTWGVVSLNQNVMIKTYHEAEAEVVFEE